MEGEPMQSYVNPELVKVSLGDLPLAIDLAVVAENGQLVFTWNCENLEGANP